MNRRNFSLIASYNPRQFFPRVDDKLLTKRLADEHEIPVPHLHFALTQQHQVRDIIPHIQQLGGFAIKPAKGSGGKGIVVISHYEQEKFYKPSGLSIDEIEIKRHLSNILAGLYSLGGATDTIIIEDLIKMDPIFEGYSFQGIPDIRVIVFRGYPVMAMLRLATQASDGKANLHQGAVGVGLEISTGKCLNAIQFGKRITHHPDTLNDLHSLQIPEWDTLLVLASRCSEMTGLGYLGVDIVLDQKRGPLLLELNARPGLAIQIANGTGLLPRIEKIEQIKKPHVSPELRVRDAQRFFATPLTP
jgi:alpha-L-glutamate ligase-like protein